jgi:ABC-type bacteriocin/lantibiotic exporter with double-glycine peptidase domain
MSCLTRTRLASLVLMVSSLAWAAGTQGIWINVPFVQQDKDGCGAASIAMVMQYWQHYQGQPANPSAAYAEIERALQSPAARGIHPHAMVRYLQQNGYRTFAFAGEWADLAQHLAKGRPLIAALNPGTGLPLHYVVVAGLEPEHQLVLLNDPAQRKLLKEDDAQFEREWKAAGHWMLLAVPEPTTHE